MGLSPGAWEFWGVSSQALIPVDAEWRVRESRRRESTMCGCEEWIMGTPQPMSFIHVLGLGWNRFKEPVSHCIQTINGT